MKVLGLIPARGGSKGVPGKNIKLLNGKPLISYTIHAGIESKLLDSIVVSTEDENIAAVSKRLGASVPFMRPQSLASDRSPTIDTVGHAIRYFRREGMSFDAICLLQPTVPFRKSADIDKAVEIFVNSGADSLISVRRIPDKYNPHWAYEPNESGYLKLATGETQVIGRRQDLPNTYSRDGSIYLVKVEVVIRLNSLFGEKIAFFENDDRPNINIDTLSDWEMAENYIRDNER